MKFRTELKATQSDIKIEYGQDIMLLGSCFADEIGQKLITQKFNAISNPFGTVYNPLILCKLLMHTIHNENYTPEDLVCHNELFFHFDMHHKFASNSEHIFLKKYVQAKEKLSNFIQNGEILILTLGTAIGYQLKSSGVPVGNCHKMPAQLFDKVDLSIEAMYDALSETIEKIKTINPKLKVLFTVSPVRHIKEGIVENTRSKARLINTVDQLIKRFDFAAYFPAYELLLDDLRDYRFYGKDLVHPNQIGVDYIWDKFLETHLNTKHLNHFQSIKKVNASIEHKAFNPKSEQHQKFLQETLKQIECIESELGTLFTAEKEQINASLNNR